MTRALILLPLVCGLAAAAGLTPVTGPSYSKLVAAQKGKVAMINFWATYCVPCRAEMPALVKLQQKYGPKGFVLVTVSADEPEDEARALQFLESRKVPAPHYLRKTEKEETFINAVDPAWSGALPASFLYDRAGRKVKALIGEADLKALEALIVKLLADGR